MKIVAIVQARMGSTRLPGKVLKKLSGKSVMEILIARLGKAKLLNEICVATSCNEENDLLSKEIKRHNVSLARGSETDVLERFYQAACATSADIIVRVTGDCPIVDPNVVDKVIKLFLTEESKKTIHRENQKVNLLKDIKIFFKTKKELDKYTTKENIMHQGYVAEIEHLEDVSIKEFIKGKNHVFS